MVASNVTSLHHIASLPFDHSDPVLAQYPGFKLGVMSSVRHYADLLMPLVRQIAAAGPDHGAWVITAPAVAMETPSAANLLCWELHRMSADALDVTLVDIRHDVRRDKRGAVGMAWKDPSKPLDYARLDFADRVRERDKFSRHLVADAAFRGRQVVFVNDICVTGAQQRTMEDYFRRSGAARVDWLYVVTVDPDVGRANPRIEWEINFASFGELLRMVTRDDISFTGKCVQRLMHLKGRELERVLVALTAEGRARLMALAILNGFESLEGFEERMELLRAYGPRAQRRLGAGLS